MRLIDLRRVSAAVGIAVFASVTFSISAASADPFRFGVLGGQAVSDDFAAQKCLAQELADGLEMPVQILALPSDSALRQALSVGAVDLAVLSTRAYSALWQSSPGAAQPVLATIGRDGSMGYRAVALSRSDAVIAGVENLKGKNIGFADRRSMPGYFVPFVALERAGLNTERDLNSIQFGGGYHATLTALESGAVDAALTWRSDAGSDSVSGDSPLQLFRVTSHANFVEFWRSSLMPNGPVVLRRALSEEAKKLVINRIATVGATVPDCLAMAFGLPVTGLFPVTHADYEAFIAADQKRISLSVASN
ncbi:phosphate/phosphite/phosphonate ABC transporter substrate-binding protein [Nisaea sp.]|uniref:phosphate/phosphite/phosphonate ABC transporter substrate-binding protein n=1 Tax=Nisaea sp. TaxID=2024842 RepID=UPI0032652D5A